MPSENESIESAPIETGDTSLRSLLASVDASHPFGPSFFLSHLRALVRDHCPQPGELPNLDLHLQTGEVLPVCHVVGLAPWWVALAVRDTVVPGSMRLEMIPYGAITRVTVRTTSPGQKGIGFESERRPRILIETGRSAEDLLVMAAQPTPGAMAE